ncbi:MAG TPA: tetratricopeptide repeat protein [bacterium]|nr:tetratricopeptide repeat protein [bacterium]
MGCQYFTDSYEAAAELDQDGKNYQAIEAYQKYLKRHPSSLLGARISLRIAKNYEESSDYNNALTWYQKILDNYPRTDEEFQTLLGLAVLYQDKLKNSAKALEYSQKAFNRYMDNIQIKDVIQSLIDAQYSTATALFTQKNYKAASGALDGIYKTFPLVLIAPGTVAKIDSLADRAKRAEAIAHASVDQIALQSEITFNKSYESDFPPSMDEGEKIIPSPDQATLAARRMAPNGKYYLFTAMVPAKGDQVVFKPILQTVGAEKPTWSPDGQELVYWRTQGGKRLLEKTNVKTKVTQTLFFTKSKMLGAHPSYHPAGNKIAYIYEGRVCLINTGDTFYKQLLKTKQKLDYTADLSWSSDGTMIRCSEDGPDPKTKKVDELLVLGLSTLPAP